jgi:hypothetical protein
LFAGFLKPSPDTGDGRRPSPFPAEGRLLGVVFEAVVPLGVVEPDREHGVAGERQPVRRTRLTCCGQRWGARDALISAYLLEEEATGLGENLP